MSPALQIVRDAVSHTFPQREEDCGQASSVLKPVIPTGDLQHLSLTESAIFLPVDGRYYVAHSPYSTAGCLVMEQELYEALRADIRLLPADLVQILVDHGILCYSRAQLVNSAPQTLEAWLHVTNGCNLDCSYCYVAKNAQYMSQEVGEQSIDALFDSALRHGFSNVKLKYAGGEPLLRFDLVCHLHKRAQLRRDETGIGLGAVLLTNGTLFTPSRVEDVKRMQLRVMVSLDGLGDDHDQQRPHLCGHGTANRVRVSILAMLEQQITPSINVTITNTNLDQVDDLVAWLLDHHLPFTLNFARDNSLAIQQKQEGWVTSWISALEQVCAVLEARLPKESLLDGLLDRSNFTAAHTHPCGAGLNYVVINHHGAVSPCQMRVHQPLRHLGHGDLVESVRRVDSGFRNVAVTAKSGCQSCEWRYWCGGGCPLHTALNNGRNEMQSPYCEVYKAIYPRLIRLEGLRLLRYGTPLSFI